jgi:hypothetical protein
MGSSGKLAPLRALISALNSATSAWRSATGSSESSFTPRSCFFRSSTASNGSRSSLRSGFIPSTTSPNMATNRR